MNKWYLYIGAALFLVGVCGATVTYVSTTDKNTDKSASAPELVTVNVSQLIAFSHLTFKEGDEVQGLLLTVTNESDTTQTFEARRKCQVTYKIFDQSNALVFDSASSTPVCTSGERVTYLMPPHVTRMFEIRHKDSAYHLKPGVYRFELDYPEYGRGDLTVTILKK